MLVKAPSTVIAHRLEELKEEARQIVASGVPENTRRTYRSQWETFLIWCQQHDKRALPVDSETLVLYLTDRSREVRVSSLRVALAAITVAHREAGMQDWAATDLPGVRVFMRGMQREKGKPPEKKQAMTIDILRAGLPDSSSSSMIRDKAILLMGFFSALRRSEISALDLEDLKTIPNGIRIQVKRSKTDKTAEGQIVSVPALGDKTVCPVTALSAWIAERGKDSGPLFTASRTGSRLQPAAIADIVKAAAKRAGCDPDDFGGHSLRSGFVTSAAQAASEERDIMQVTRHTSERTLRGYIQEATLGENHPGRKIVEG